MEEEGTMWVWPTHGWVEYNEKIKKLEGKIETHESGVSFRNEYITWLDEEGGLLCTCNQGSEDEPCAHGRYLLSVNELKREALPFSITGFDRNRNGLFLDTTPLLRKLAEALGDADEAIDEGEGILAGDEYLFFTSEGWLKISSKSAHALKSVLNKAQDVAGKRIWLPETAMSDILTMSSQGGDVKFSEKIEKFLRFANRTPGKFTPPSIEGNLDKAQLEGVQWMFEAFEYDVGGILADQMGVGKTLQIIAHIQKLKEEGYLKRAIISVPTSAIDHWLKEVHRFTPGIDVLTWAGPERTKMTELIDKVDLVITTHKIMSIDEKLLRSLDWTFFAADEAQDAKNPNSELALACATLPAKQKIAITGTPVENRLTDLHTLFTITNPGLLGRLVHFRRDICQPVHRDDPNAEEIIENLYKLVAPFMLHRTQKSAGLSIPEPKIERKFVNLQADREVYDIIRQNARNALTGKDIAIFQHITLMRQAAADYRLIAGDHDAPESSKTQWIADYIIDRVVDQRQVLVFSTWTTHLELIRKAIINRGLNDSLIGQIDGSLTRRQRRWAEKDFKEGRTRILQMTMKSGGRSLNLPEADDVIIGVPWWNPAVMMQAAYRAVRRGQDKTINVVIPVAEKSIEERMMEIQDQKANVSSLILRPAVGSGGLTKKQIYDLIMQD